MVQILLEALLLYCATHSACFYSNENLSKSLLSECYRICSFLRLAKLYRPRKTVYYVAWTGYDFSRAGLLTNSDHLHMSAFQLAGKVAIHTYCAAIKDVTNGSITILLAIYWQNRLRLSEPKEFLDIRHEDNSKE